jgi:hypothetical protein
MYMRLQSERWGICAWPFGHRAPTCWSCPNPAQYYCPMMKMESNVAPQVCEIAWWETKTKIWCMHDWIQTAVMHLSFHSHGFPTRKFANIVLPSHAKLANRLLPVASHSLRQRHDNLPMAGTTWRNCYIDGRGKVHPHLPNLWDCPFTVLGGQNVA